MIQFQALKILYVSHSAVLSEIKNCFKPGCAGYVQRNCAVQDFTAAITALLQNNRHVAVRNYLSFIPGSPLPEATPKMKMFKKLTGRQKQIAAQLIQGKSQIDICLNLGLQRSTVSTHKYRIFDKLQIVNLLELLKYKQYFEDTISTINQDCKNGLACGCH